MHASDVHLPLTMWHSTMIFGEYFSKNAGLSNTSVSPPSISHLIKSTRERSNCFARCSSVTDGTLMFLPRPLPTTESTELPMLPSDEKTTPSLSLHTAA